MKYILPILFTGLFTQAYAQPTIVKDINPNVFSSNPSRLTVYDGQLFYFADDDVKGYELWRTDRTDTKLVKDIYSGSGDAAPNVPNKNMAVIGYDIYFPADNGVTGLELYKYNNGKASLVSDIRGGKSGSDIEEIIALNGKLYFNANNGVFGNELWSYDPVKNEAACVSFINPGPKSSDPKWLTVLGNKIYFTAYEPSKGREMYVHNTATGQTNLFNDFYDGPKGSDPTCLTSDGTKLYYIAAYTGQGREIWIHEGTSNNRITNLTSNNINGIADDIEGLKTIGIIGNELYLAGYDSNYGYELYKSDMVSMISGSPLVDINKSGNSTPAGFTYYAGKIFFTADDGVHGRELWVLDKNDNATMVADINTNSAVSINPNSLIVYDNKLYFTAYGTNGNELYVYTDAAASIVNQKYNLNIKVYPNPTANNVNIQLSLPNAHLLSTTLTNAVGQVVINQPKIQFHSGTNTIKLDLSNYPSGIYYYRISNKQMPTIATGRIIKQ